MLFEHAGFKPGDFVPELGTTIGEALLAPHRSYLRLVLPLLDTGLIRGMAHITGGGITDNLPRILPDDCGAAIEAAAWDVPPIFTLLRSHGGIDIAEMFRTFNMGIGLVVVCAAGDRTQVLKLLFDAGEPGAVVIGAVVAGDRDVRYTS